MALAGKPQRLITVLAFYGSLIVLMAWLLLVWLGRSAELRHEIDQLEHERNAQEALRPFMLDLMARSTEEIKEGFEIPESRPLPRSELTKLEALVKGAVAQSDSLMVSVVPRSMEVGVRYDRVPVDVSAEGELQTLRRFLLALCRIPFMEHLRELEFRSRGDGRVDMRVVIVISVR